MQLVNVESARHSINQIYMAHLGNHVCGCDVAVGCERPGVAVVRAASVVWRTELVDAEVGYRPLYLFFICLLARLS